MAENAPFEQEQYKTAVAAVRQAATSCDGPRFTYDGFELALSDIIAGIQKGATAADRPRAEEEYEIDPPLTPAQAVQVQTVIDIAVMRDRAEREKDEPRPEPSNDKPEVEVGEDAHGIFAAGGGWRVPTDQIYQHLPEVTATRGMQWGAQVTATDQPIVIDSLAGLAELDSIDLRLWARSTRKLLTVLGYPLDRLNQIIADLIFAEED